MEPLDHIPSAEELTQIYANSEKDDPRSLFYKRILVRPKLSVWGIVRSFLIAAVVCAGIYIAASFFVGVWGCIFSVFGGLILLCIFFAKQLLIGAVKAYQALAPDRVRNRCRYEPSCSVYMLLSVEKFGFWKGLKQGITRWKSCKPPNGGIDYP